MPDRTIYTFSEIISKIQTAIGNKSTSLTDFTPGSNLQSMIDAFAHFVEFLQLQTNIAIEAFNFGGANGSDLDERVQDYGLVRKLDIAATVPVLFKRNTAAPSDFTIYAGSQISTQPDVFGNTIDYTLISDLVFPSGSISVSGLSTCLTSGTIGNLPSGYITNMTSSIPGVDSVTNPVAATDGADRENDDQLRARAAVFINGLKAGNSAAIKAAALSVDGVTVSQVQQNIPELGQVTVFISNQSGVLTNAQVDAVKTAVDDAAAFGILTNIITPTVININVSMDVTYSTDFYKDVAILQSSVNNAIFNFVMNNTQSTLKLVDLQVLVYTIPGVTNVKNVKIAGVADDYTTDGYNVVRLADKTTASININYTGA